MTENNLFIKKENLHGSDYNWFSKDKDSKTLFVNEPSRRVFDRNNGNQLLYIINYFMNTNCNYSHDNARLLEELLQNHLPLGIKSEISVYYWLTSAYANLKTTTIKK